MTPQQMRSYMRLTKMIWSLEGEKMKIESNLLALMEENIKTIRRMRIESSDVGGS